MPPRHGWYSRWTPSAQNAHTQHTQHTQYTHTQHNTHTRIHTQHSTRTQHSTCKQHNTRTQHNTHTNTHIPHTHTQCNTSTQHNTCTQRTRIQHTDTHTHNTEIHTYTRVCGCRWRPGLAPQRTHLQPCCHTPQTTRYVTFTNVLMKHQIMQCVRAFGVPNARKQDSRNAWKACGT